MTTDAAATRRTITLAAGFSFYRYKVLSPRALSFLRNGACHPLAAVHVELLAASRCMADAMADPMHTKRTYDD